MRRSSVLLLKQGVTSAAGGSKPTLFNWRKPGNVNSNYKLWSYLFSSSAGGRGIKSEQEEKANQSNQDNDSLTFAEVKKIMRLVNVGALKTKLVTEGKETISYSELLEACESMGVANSNEEAKEFVNALEDVHSVLILRDKVYLHPDKVVDVVRRSATVALRHEDESWREELKILEAKLEDIDMSAHRQVRRIFWTGLGFGLATTSCCFRLTFWEFSWHVMSPVLFFVATSGIIINYVYFLTTSRDPSYQDLLKRLFLSRRRKLIKKRNFDMDRLMELRTKCKSSVFIF